MSNSDTQKELERKFVLHNMPVLSMDAKDYRQYYIPNPVDLVVRPRQEGRKLVLQLKRRDEAGGDPEESDKLDLSNVPNIFALLVKWAQKENGPSVKKDRYTVPQELSPGAKECIIDRFKGSFAKHAIQLEGHILAEAEFETAEAKAMWQIPQWMIDVGYTEVTGDPRYNNEWMAEHGWPEGVNA